MSSRGFMMILLELELILWKLINLTYLQAVLGTRMPANQKAKLKRSRYPKYS